MRAKGEARAGLLTQVSPFPSSELCPVCQLWGTALPAAARCDNPFTTACSAVAGTALSTEWEGRAGTGRSRFCSFLGFLSGVSRRADWLQRQVQAKVGVTICAGCSAGPCSKADGVEWRFVSPTEKRGVRPSRRRM